MVYEAPEQTEAREKSFELRGTCKNYEANEIFVKDA